MTNAVPAAIGRVATQDSKTSLSSRSNWHAFEARALDIRCQGGSGYGLCNRFLRDEAIDAPGQIPISQDMRNRRTMKRSRIGALLIGCAALVSCNPNVEQNSGSGTTPLDRGGGASSDELVQPVVIGQFGPRFDACQATGVVRSVSGEGELPVRAAPFDRARQLDTITNGDRVFVCNRSHDQSWLAIVYAENGELSGTCGVSAPVTSRRQYDGPCLSGWVSSAFIQLRAAR